MEPVISTSTEQITIVPGKYYPTLALDLENRAGVWFASLVCHADKGGLDCWRGAYPCREAAIRNGALYGRDMLRARGLPDLVDALTEFFQLPSPDRAAQMQLNFSRFPFVSYETTLKTP